MRNFFEKIQNIILVIAAIIVILILIYLVWQVILFFIDIAKLLLWLGTLGSIIFIGIILFVICKLF